MTKADPDQYLNKLVMAALTVFVVVSLLLAAFVAREIWLQQRIVGLSSSLQTNLEELEQTTEEIQSKVSELEAADASAPDVQGWDNVNELLEDVDQQLESIEETMDEVVVVSEEQLEIAPADSGEELTLTPVTRAHADQVFTIFAVLIGIAAIAIAILLTLAIRVNTRHLST